jgi:hypothetical protein
LRSPRNMWASPLRTWKAQSGNRTASCSKRPHFEVQARYTWWHHLEDFRITCRQTFQLNLFFQIILAFFRFIWSVLLRDMISKRRAIFDQFSSLALTIS